MQSAQSIVHSLELPQLVTLNLQVLVGLVVELLLQEVVEAPIEVQLRNIGKYNSKKWQEKSRTGIRRSNRTGTDRTDCAMKKTNLN
jgi:hypothetical protein